MLNTLRRRMANEDEGFTLIELMVVVLIIAILMAIAIPTFLGAQDRARDRGAQSNLRNAITAAKTIATDSAGLFVRTGSTTILDETDLSAAEGSLVFVNGTSAVGEIDVVTSTGGADILLTTKSASGKFFGIKATSAGLVTYCSDTTAVPITCTGTKW